MKHGTSLYLLLGALALTGAAAWWYFANQDSGDSDDDVDAAGSSAGGIVSSILGAVTPRGIRNNNPGNIRISDNAWVGKVTPNTDGTFEQFDVMANGIRALAITLQNYQRLYGLNTVRGIIDRWSATDQDSYVANVSSALAVNPDDPIDLTNGDTLENLITAIITQENGFVVSTLVSNSDIQQGIALA